MTDILMRPVIALQVWVHELRDREDGQTTTEYAILLGFLAIAIIIALFFLRNVLRGLLERGEQRLGCPRQLREARHKRLASGPPMRAARLWAGKGRGGGTPRISLR